MLSRSSALASGALAVAMTVGYLAQGGFAAGTPANKVAGAGSETEVVGANADVILLSETVKINNPTDLILSASAECSIITQVKTTGNQTARAEARVLMWVEIDGIPVPVSEDDTDKGKVVFCDRIHEQETKLDGDEDDENDDFVRTYLSTRTANAFNWMALNVGTAYPGTSNNTHVVELHATLITQNPVAETFANAAVGNRTLILEPVKSAHREAVTPLN